MEVHMGKYCIIRYRDKILCNYQPDKEDTVADKIIGLR